MKSTSTSEKIASPSFKVLRLSPEEEAELDYQDIPKMHPGTTFVRTSLEEMKRDWERWKVERKRMAP